MVRWLWKTLKLMGAARILITGWRDQRARARERRELEDAQNRAKELLEERGRLLKRLGETHAKAESSERSWNRSFTGRALGRSLLLQKKVKRRQK